MTIADELQHYNDGLIDAYDAVDAKGGTIPQNKNLDNLPTAIGSISGGGGEPGQEKDINFYDYDGTLVESWTLAELQDKTALPTNPTAPTGLTAKGWNWTLQELKTENTPTNVGQLYSPTDGKTHLFVEVDADHLTPNLAIGVNGTAIVDWGDGSSTTTFTGSDLDVGQNSYHTYAQAGSYEVTIEIPTGSAGRIRGNVNYVSFLWKGEISQQSITRQNIDYAQQAKVLWLGERMDIANSGGLHLLGIETLIIPDYYPASSLEYFCQECPNLSSTITLPPTITIIGINFLNNCYSFNQPITIPNTVTSIGNNFLNNCYVFNRPLTIPNTVTSIDNNFLHNCSSFNRPLIISNTVTSIASSFLHNCYSFNQPITIPNTVTSIGGNFLRNCSSFNQPLTIPSMVTSIENSFLNDCPDFSNLTVETTTSPTDNSSLATGNIAAKMYVKGITVTGAGASTWITNLPDRASSPYRKLIQG